MTCGSVDPWRLKLAPLATGGDRNAVGSLRRHHRGVAWSWDAVHVVRAGCALKLRPSRVNGRAGVVGAMTDRRHFPAALARRSHPGIPSARRQRAAHGPAERRIMPNRLSGCRLHAHRATVPLISVRDRNPRLQAHGMRRKPRPLARMPRGPCDEWNARIAEGHTGWWSPSIRAALVAEYHWLTVYRRPAK